MSYLHTYFRESRLHLVLVLLVFCPAMAWSLEIIETKEGSVLLKTNMQTGKDGLMKESGRDPFNWPTGMFAEKEMVKIDGSEPLFSSLQLSGILWDKNMPLAVIDNVLVQEGESVKGILVKSIFWDRVLLESGNSTHTLRFKDLFELGKP